jgi:hypothetical protein
MIYLRITSSVTVGFPILLGELDRENDLTALKLLILTCIFLASKSLS